jgi:hypothetical protein
VVERPSVRDDDPLLEGIDRLLAEQRRTNRILRRLNWLGLAVLVVLVLLLLTALYGHFVIPYPFPFGPYRS